MQCNGSNGIESCVQFVAGRYRNKMYAVSKAPSKIVAKTRRGMGIVILKFNRSSDINVVKYIFFQILCHFMKFAGIAHTQNIERLETLTKKPLESEQGQVMK